MTADDPDRYNIDAALGRHGGAERNGRGYWKKREGTNFVKTYGQGTTTSSRGCAATAATISRTACRQARPTIASSCAGCSL